MVNISKRDAEILINKLSNSKDKEILGVIKKLNSPQKKLKYVYSKEEIKRLLKIAYKEKRKIKISYYSFSSDEVTNRVVDIYKIHSDCIVAFCNLRNEERTFVLKRINKAALLGEKYSKPKKLDAS